ncbi:2'-5' RNA ligase family protein [Cellulomonas alba]|uniref:RNA 2',3'-cyclic phosphodiesterase n=1 Tax=Cellulomonas alba TaxID=3053467 RepID=A0ABT7SL07_9CELL|nr:2'-5' RNA ligase family protein [Cellulomonas alba]MDM7856232.1 2'-5' RNA ligase family protein [Cellulomonas alba]
MRLFAAVWPPDDVLDHLDLALATVRGGPAALSSSIRWSARDAWHVTAAFYGELPDGALPGLAAGLRSALAGVAPYELALRGAGVFSHRTLWVGVGGAVDAQRAVSGACVQSGVEAGAAPDSRPRERPHLTIGRVRPGARPPRRRTSRPGGSSAPDARAGRPVAASEPGQDAEAVARALAVYSGPAWTVDEVLLVESRPGAGRGGGPLYAPVDVIALEAPR